MTTLRLLATAALASTALAQQSSAQRPAPIGLSSAVPVALTLSPHRVMVETDTAKTRTPRPLPFVLGGAAIGGVIGAVLAASYSLCDSDPSRGVHCSSTDPATGAIIGMGIGAAAGGLLWALIRYSGGAQPAGSSGASAR
jgi:H+/Cl- antiporter ClcA